MHVGNLKEILQPTVLGENKKSSHHNLQRGPRLDNYVYPESSEFWLAVARYTVNLAIFILTSYALGHSRLNPIECSWAPISKWLTGVTLPITLVGKASPGVEFAGLSEHEIFKRKAEVLMRHAPVAANIGKTNQSTLFLFV